MIPTKHLKLKYVVTLTRPEQYEGSEIMFRSCELKLEIAQELVENLFCTIDRPELYRIEMTAVIQTSADEPFA